MGKLRSFRALPASDRRQAIRALTVLSAVTLGLRCFGYGRCHRWLGRMVSRAQGAAGRAARLDVEAVRRRTHDVVRAVRLAERNLGTAKCLDRSLALWWMLSRDGVPAQVRVGVRRAGAGIEAHAWVDVMGHPLDASDVGDRYSPFDQSLLGNTSASMSELEESMAAAPEHSASDAVGASIAEGPGGRGG